MLLYRPDEREYAFDLKLFDEIDPEVSASREK